MAAKDKPTTADEDYPLDLKTLLGAMSDAVLVLNREGRWLAAAPTLAYESPSARRRLDFLIGKTFHEVEPEQADRLLAVVAAALDTGQTQQIEYEVHPDPNRTFWFAAAVSPIDKDRVVWVARNVTDRVQARHALEDRVDERTRDLAALLRISHTVVSTLDLHEVLGLLLDEARTVIPYFGASVNLVEGNEVVVLDARSPDNDYKLGARFPLDTKSPIWEAMDHGEPVIVPDMLDESDRNARSYRKGTRDAGHGQVEALKRIRSWMAVPIAHRGKVLGSLSMSRPEPGFFTEEHAHLAMAIAGQAAVAIENARLFEEEAERTKQLGVLLDVSRELTATRTLRELAAAMLEQLKRVIDYTGGSAVEFIEGGMLRIIESVGPDGRETAIVDDTLVTAPGQSMWSRVLKGEPIVVDDVLGDSAEAKMFRATMGERMQRPEFDYIRSWMAMPLGLEDRVVGMLSISKGEPAFFTDAHVEMAMAIARHGAVAAENARLFEQTDRGTREMSALFEISKALSSTLELKPLMDLMLDEMQKIVSYDGAGIMLAVEDGLRQFAVRRPESVSLRPYGDVAQIWRKGGFVWESAVKGEVSLVLDVLGDSATAKLYRETWGGSLENTPTEYARCLVCVPLMAQGRLVGAISLAHREPNFYTPEHIALLQAVAGPAATAIENARLFAQAQARTRELGALLEVSRAVVSTLNVRDLMGAILDELQTILPHDGSSVVVLEHNELVIVDSRAREGARRELGARFSIADSGILWERIGAGNHLIIPDIRADEPRANSYRQVIGGAGLLTVKPFTDIRSWMGVPLMVGDQAIGMVTMSRTEPDYFTEDHARLVGAFANQAATAIENARLFEQTQRQAREMEALFRSDEQIFRSLDLDEVLQALADVAVDLLGAEKIVVTTWDAARQRLIPRAARGWSEKSVRFMQTPEGQMLPTSAPERMQTVEITIDTVQGPWRDILEEEGIHHWAALALMSPEGEVLGSVAAAYPQDRSLTDADKRMLLALAERAVIAVTNAGLHARDRQLTALEERQRLARELHDSVSQALYGIALGARTARTVLDRDPAKAVAPVDYVLALAEAGLAEMRALIFELRPESLQAEGIVAALNKQIAATSARYEIAITAELADEPDLPLDAKEMLYRIGQEALHNIVKHASATSVRVCLQQVDSRIELTIADDGIGFDPDGDFPGHLGLRSMRERAAKANGTLSIESKPGTGSTVTVSIASSASQ